MRRLLRSIARGEEISQDISTLENPAIVAQLRGEEPPRTAGATRPAVTRSAVAKKTVRTAAIRKAPGKKRAINKAAARKKTSNKAPARKKKAAKRTSASKPGRRRAPRTGR
jgi:hypothetical protein